MIITINFQTYNTRRDAYYTSNIPTIYMKCLIQTVRPIYSIKLKHVVEDFEASLVNEQTKYLPSLSFIST